MIQLLLCLLAIAASSNPVVLKQRLQRRGWAPPTTTPAPTTTTTTTTTAAPATTSAPATPSPTSTPYIGYSIVSAVTGTFARGGQLTGSYVPTEFNYEQEQLMVTGVLTALLTRTTRGGRTVNVANGQQVVNMPVILPTAAGGAPNLPVGGLRRLLQLLSSTNNSNSNSSSNSSSSSSGGNSTNTTTGSGGGVCKVLHLSLQGPTDLNLLGVLVHLNPVELDVTAQPGGGLLGSLLCSLSGLLNNLPLDLGDLASLTGGGNQLSTLLNSVLDILDLSNLPTQDLGGLDQVTGLLNSIVGLLNLG